MDNGEPSGEGSRHGNPEIVFIESQRRHPCLLHKGYRYTLNKVNQMDSRSLWRCANRGECSASLKLNQERNVVLNISAHACRKNFVKNEVALMLVNCKKEVCQNYASVKEIYEKNALVFHNRTERTILQIPPYSNYEQKKDGQFFGDGTFKRVPKPFKQLFSLHMDVGSTDETTNIVPMVYALLPDKTKKTYERLFHILKYELCIDIMYYKSDYEMAQYTTFKAVYPDTELTGCFFHFSKAIWKKAEKINFTSTAEQRQAVRLTANLPLLPTPYLGDAWVTILQAFTDSIVMRKFHKYVHTQWVNLPMISCAEEMHRTTNSTEAWHRRLKNRVPPKPTFIRFLEKIKLESKVQDIQITNNFLNANNRKKKDIAFNKNYINELKKLQEGKLTS
ncbi:uncharacterized protein LOC133529973 [Cydia pomonella]|uniref:uncharacterized protein LOC133529973 n=1 Tax=Cydia pomonella TaxID=82600 RepID=UPI002ADD8BA3|nr:uncharacterized protein LOC133529973 [Cydia pomonella]